MKHLFTCAFLFTTLTIASAAAAQMKAAAPADSADGAKTSDAPAAHRSGVLLGGKVGGLVPFGGLSPNARVGVEAGYVFPFCGGCFGAALDVDFAAPKAHGSNPNDPRVNGGSYNWHLTEQELSFMPVLMYRLTSIKAVTPYAGIGPRILLLRSTVKGDANGSPIAETTEQSTKVGVGIPLGVEIPAGPGDLMAELLFEYGSLNHRATGTTNSGGLNLMLGYRFLL
jgi:opacity protein-like surface antigen